MSIETLISEHYTAADPTQSPDLERFFYANGFGKVRWEYRSTNIAYGYPDNPPLNPSLHLVDVRHYTNLVPPPKSVVTPVGTVPAKPLRIADFGWPPNFVLP